MSYFHLASSKLCTYLPRPLSSFSILPSPPLPPQPASPPPPLSPSLSLPSCLPRMQVWDDINSGAAVKCTSLLNRFYLLTFAVSVNAPLI